MHYELDSSHLSLAWIWQRKMSAQQHFSTFLLLFVFFYLCCHCRTFSMASISLQAFLSKRWHSTNTIECIFIQYPSCFHILTESYKCLCVPNPALEPRFRSTNCRNLNRNVCTNQNPETYQSIQTVEISNRGVRYSRLLMHAGLLSAAIH